MEPPTSSAFKDSDAASWRRRPTGRETTKRTMAFSIPPPVSANKGGKMTSPVPQLAKNLLKNPPKSSAKKVAFASSTPLSRSQSASRSSQSSQRSQPASQRSGGSSSSSLAGTPMSSDASGGRYDTPDSIRSVLEAEDARPSAKRGSAARSKPGLALKQTTLKTPMGGPKTNSGKRGRKDAFAKPSTAKRASASTAKNTKKSTPSTKGSSSMGSSSKRTKTSPVASAARTPASGKSARQPPKRKQISAAKASAKAPAKKRKKKIGSDDEAEDEDADVVTRTVKIRPVGVSARRPDSLTDVDILLDAMERCVRDYIATVSGKPIRRLLVDFYQECEVVGRENIEMLEEQRVVQQALRSAESIKKAHRKELLEMHRRRADVQARLKEAEQQYRTEEAHRKDMEEAHALLCDVDSLCASSGGTTKGKGKGKGKAKKVSGRDFELQLSAMVNGVAAITSSLPALVATNASLRQHTAS